MLRFCVFLGFLLFSLKGTAEYRAFLLRIQKVTNPGEFRELISTLDPLQYPGYFPLKEDEQVAYVRTWMCWGRTSEKPICPDPNAAPSAEDPTAADAAPSTPTTGSPSQTP